MVKNMKKILVFVLTVNLCSSQMLLLAGKTPADWKSQSRAVHSALYQAVLNEEEGRLDIALEHIRKTKMQDRAAAARAREEGARRGTVLFALDDGEERYIPVLRGMPFLYEPSYLDSKLPFLYFIAIPLPLAFPFFEGPVHSKETPSE